MSITLIVYIRSKLNNMYFSIARLFVGRPSSVNVAAVRFGKVSARPSAIFFARHASLGADLQPDMFILGKDPQPDMFV